ncbi:pimeloyl-ACP methyl ester carboxylesterase [Brevibacterium sanguinis]|uniref:Pimeloyl-ACP methyl ester carboxylesterase n=2 Tax=Brevibacterium TaxID=1696 RepID=A0A366ILS3_9MICO|nr:MULTISPECIES: alpha/beta hydrolase [Brevibacterium]RBP65588.1 pimeloyl-ACP methyl ester carboxylesterase [Brevibacterium sanguinis]RBP72222.1 pimeloyl-ACP methyl ester carboxylesterase [Brevibacterium celere]
MALDLNRPGPESDWIATFGTGEPHTLFGHGFAGAIRDTRPFGTGISGTRHFLHLPGHGGRPSPGPGWTYGTVAEVLAAALTTTSATRALGVSMSAGGLLRLLATESPAARRLEKVALVLPASFTGFTAEATAGHRSHLERLRGLVASGDVDGVADLMLSREPVEVAALLPARAWTRAKAENLVRTDMSDGLGLALEVAVDSGDEALAALARLTGDVLVLTHEDDPAHPVEVAEDIAAAIPGARLEVLPAGSILWKGRHEVRRILTAFFD